jgi:hypothetical protein
MVIIYDTIIITLVITQAKLLRGNKKRFQKLFSEMLSQSDRNNLFT